MSRSEHGQNYCYPLNSVFINDPVNGFPASGSLCNTALPPGYGFRYSDERHWDNMGFEVLPAGTASATDFSSFVSRVQPYPKVPPTSSGARRADRLRIVGLLFETFFPKFPLPGLYANSTTDLRR